jgi:cyclophilin family peptidyl-prolyl cis-trans isomerase
MKTTMNLFTLSMMFIAMTFSTQFAGAQSVVMTNQESKITHTIIMNTNHGSVTIGLYGDDAPKTVDNFVGLAEKNFYDGILFHRVVPGFVIQAGDPKTKDESMKSQWGTGGESIYGGDFVDELNSNTKSYQVGYKVADVEKFYPDCVMYKNLNQVLQLNRTRLAPDLNSKGKTNECDYQ